MRYTATVLILCSAFAQANELDQCIHKNVNGSQGLTGCYGEEFARKDKRLATMFAKKINALSFNKEFENEGWSEDRVMSQKDLLGRSQKQWEKYREDWCRYVADAANGTGSALAFVDCQIQITDQRMKEIRKW